MTRLEQYSNVIAVFVGLCIILLCGLIAHTVVEQFKSNRPLTNHAVFAPHVPETTTGTTTKQSTTTATSGVTPPQTEISSEGNLRYAVITGSCDFAFVGECVRVHSSPGTAAPTVAKLRNEMVLRIAEEPAIEKDGHLWYKVIFDETLHYPERNKTAWYVAGDYLKIFTDIGRIASDSDTPTTSPKRIVVDRSDQTLVAYDGDEIFMSVPISSGLDLTPTPRGVFSIFLKTPSRYMQGPLKGISNQYYDLPGVPWNLYFTEQGAVIHGAYWHNSFGKPYSHGCVNLSPENAEKLYRWADLGVTVTIRD